MRRAEHTTAARRTRGSLPGREAMRRWWGWERGTAPLGLRHRLHTQALRSICQTTRNCTLVWPRPGLPRPFLERTEIRFVFWSEPRFPKQPRARDGRFPDTLSVPLKPTWVTRTDVPGSPGLQGLRRAGRGGDTILSKRHPPNRC